jgi:hypothetical protein
MSTVVPNAVEGLMATPPNDKLKLLSSIITSKPVNSETQCLMDSLTLEHRTDRLTRNVLNNLPVNAA